MSGANKKITVKMILDKDPCKEWTEERIRKYIGKGKTLLEILNMRIDAKDRIWTVTRFLTDKQNRKFAIWCARQCKTKNKAVIEYIDVIEKYYAGKATQEQLDAAYSAADSAADLAAYRAADWAAYSAAYRAADLAAYRAADWAAYRAADWAAYRAAYRAADWAAYSAAYRAAMKKKQIVKLKEIIS